MHAMAGQPGGPGKPAPLVRRLAALAGVKGYACLRMQANPYREYMALAPVNRALAATYAGSI